MKAGFCHYHKYTLTFRQMRKHGCLNKHGTWCKRFEPNLDHPWWKDRLEAGRSKDVSKPFTRKKERKSHINEEEEY